MGTEEKTLKKLLIGEGLIREDTRERVNAIPINPPIIVILDRPLDDYDNIRTMAPPKADAYCSGIPKDRLGRGSEVAVQYYRLLE